MGILESLTDARAADFEAIKVRNTDATSVSADRARGSTSHILNERRRRYGRSFRNRTDIHTENPQVRPRIVRVIFERARRIRL